MSNESINSKLQNLLPGTHIVEINGETMHVVVGKTESIKAEYDFLLELPRESTPPGLRLINLNEEFSAIVFNGLKSLFPTQITSANNTVILPIIQILREVAVIVDALEDKGISPIDIEPEAFGRTNEGKVVMSRLAIATKSRATGPSGYYINTGGKHLIQKLPPYIAPEEFKLCFFPNFTSVYLIGTLALRLINGLFNKLDSKNHLVCINRQSSRDLIRTAELSKSFPYLNGKKLEIENAILKAINKNPADRYESCTNFVKALFSALVAGPEL